MDDIISKIGGLSKKTDGHPSVLIANEEKEAEVISKIASEKLSKEFDFDINDKQFQRFISAPVGFITTLFNLTPKGNSDKFEWHKPQLAWFANEQDSATFKCRQAGFSLAVAAKFASRAQLINTDHSFLFVSITRDEAQNKILYCKELLDSMPLQFRRTILYETKQSIEFKNKDGTVSRIISHAQRPARGSHGDICYDEADFYNQFKLLYDSGLPGTKKVGGKNHVISTPFDPFGYFRRMVDPRGFYGSEDFQDEFPTFKRFKIVWWFIPYYCNDLEGAKQNAMFMSTKDRVYKYGTKLLIEAYENSSSEDIFQQEYEARFLEKVSLYFRPEDIRACTARSFEDIVDRDYSLDFGDPEDDQLPVQDQENFKFPMESLLLQNRIIPKLYGNPENIDSIVELIDAFKKREISGNLIGGFDVARTGDSSDLFIGEIFPVKDMFFIVARFWARKNNWKLTSQQEFLDMLFDNIPFIAFGMDTNGLGAQMGDYFTAKHPSFFESIPMNSKNLDRCLPSLHKCLEKRLMVLPAYVEFSTGLTGVRRDISAMNNSVWIMKRKKGNHCDNAISTSIVATLALEKFGGGLRMADNSSFVSAIASAAAERVEMQKRVDRSHDAFSRAAVRGGFANSRLDALFSNANRRRLT